MFAGYDEDSKLFSAIVATLSCEKIRTVTSATQTRAFPLIKTINGTAAGGQRGLTNDIKVQRIFVIRRLNQYWKSKKALSKLFHQKKFVAFHQLKKELS